MNDTTTRKRYCECNCGYRCGGPGACELDIMECLSKDDGKHYVRDCGHEFDGPTVEFDLGSSVTCSKCGITAIGHDMRVGP